MGQSFFPAILPNVYKAKVVQHVHGLAWIDMCKILGSKRLMLLVVVVMVMILMFVMVMVMVVMAVVVVLAFVCDEIQLGLCTIHSYRAVRQENRWLQHVCSLSVLANKVVGY